MSWEQMSRIQQVLELEAHLRAQLPCHDCGAPAGAYCKPEYGCTPLSRRSGAVADDNHSKHVEHREER